MRRDERGVTTVVGAVLVFGILVFGLTIVTSQYVPIWDKQRERAAMIESANEFNVLKADLDRLAANASGSPISVPMTLTRSEGYTFFRTPDIPSVLRFNPAAAGDGFTFNASAITIQESESASFLGLAETWRAIPDGVQSVPSVGGIAHLRLRVADPANATGSLNVTMTDARGHCAARLHLAVAPAGGGRNVETRVFGPATPRAATCAATPLTIENDYLATAPPYLYVDALDARLGFHAAATASTAPSTLAFARSGLAAESALVYDALAGGVSLRTGGSGLSFENYGLGATVGELQLHLQHVRLPQQVYSLEYGAVFLEQPEGAALTTPPVFTAGTTATRASVSWTFPALGGGAAAVTGTQTANVLATPSGVRTYVLGTAPDATYTLATSHPELWRAYWQKTLDLTGFSSKPVPAGPGCAVSGSAPHYQITTTATTATLRIAGPCPMASDATEDVQVQLQSAGITVAPRAGG